MKTRNGFVSNSSSTSFLITNNSTTPADIVDFCKENLYLVDNFNREYDWNSITHEQMISSAENNNIYFLPGETKECIFGDESGTSIGLVYDYILRGNGSSENWHWEEYASLR